MEENYFHAVLEAVKGVAERLREMSGLGMDGAELINRVFSVKSPIIALNSLATDTEQSEQKGIANMLLGVFGAIRNPVAHAPKIVWAMPEQDRSEEHTSELQSLMRISYAVFCLKKKKKDKKTN